MTNIATKAVITDTSLDFHALPEFDGHEFLIALTDKASGMKAFVAIHNRNLGIAHGGTRLRVYENEEDAIKDVLSLSKAMTYKSALAGLPYGGAKGVIIAPHSGNKNDLLKIYAERINSLGGLFHTGTDVGLTDDDVTEMARYCSYILGSNNASADYSTSKAAAIGVYYAIKAACVHKYASADLAGKTIGIKGVGKLGSELARLLYSEGASLILADVNHQAVQELADSLPGSRVVDPGQIHKETMDIYAPCALGNEFTVNTIDELRCGIISGGANNQLENDKIGDDLHSKGVIYVPDYIANAGGLIFVSEELEEDGYSKQRLEARLANIQNTVARVLKISQEDNQPTHRVADRLAWEILEGAVK